MLALGAERDEVSVVTDQIGCPTWTGHLAAALVELAERPEETGIFHIAGAGSCSWNELALEIFDVAGIDCRVLPTTTESFHRPAPRPACSVLGTERAEPLTLPRWQDGVAQYVRGMDERRSGSGAVESDSEPQRSGLLMKLLVCGGAGFIGSNFVRVRVREHGDEVVVLDKLTYAGRRENLADLDVALRPRRDRGRRGRRRGDRRRRRRRELRRRDPRRPLDRRARRVRHDPRRRAPRCCSKPPATAGVRYLQVSTDEVYGSIEDGSFTESSPLAPSSPYSATKAGADLLVSSYFHTFGLQTLICRGSNNYGPYQYPEKLIPLMVLNALHGDRLPVYGDGMQVRNWLYVEDFARGIGHVLDRRRAGRGLQRRRPRRVPEHRGRPAHHRADAAPTSR